MQKKVFILSVLLTCLLCGCTSANTGVELLEVYDEAAYSSSRESGLNEDAPARDPETDAASEKEPVPYEEEPDKVVVFVCGAVENPGVYEFTTQNRIDDAIKAAGGFTGEADKEYVNLAAKLVDGTKLEIPTVSEVEQSAAAAPSKGPETYDKPMEEASNPESGGLVNINTASKDQLKTLPGIGDGIAGKIINYREENGSFKTKEDIMNVSGIKEKLFSKISDHITV